MDERVVQFRVGVVVVATLIILATLMLYFGEWPFLGRDSYQVFVRFDRAPRVTADTPVRKSGILIGRVAKVEFAEEDPHRADDKGVVVTMNIYRRYILRHDEIFQVDANLLGDATIDVVQSEKINQPPTPIQPGEYIDTGAVKPDVFEALTLMQQNLPRVMDEVGTAAQRMGELSLDLSRLVRDNEAEINRIVRKSELAVDTLQKTLASTNDILQNEELRENIRLTIEQMPKVLSDSRSTLDSIRKTFNSFDTVVTDLRGITGPLQERGPAIMSGIEDSTTKLAVLMDELTALAKAIQNPEGTLGQLMNNPDLYQSLNDAAKNIDEITEQVRPILYDVRCFTDKMSRHPGVILRDAIKPQSGLK